MTEIYGVVFQMGKVASTAITKALGSLRQVEAAHCHFLGEDALRKVLRVALNPANTDYFFNHQMGQMAENAAITRAINRIRAGTDPRRLVVLSLTRDPFTWFRSSVLQDISGYADLLCDLAPENASANRDARVRLGLTRFLGHLEEHLSDFPTVEDCLEASRSGDPHKMGRARDWPHQQRQLLLSALRPADWFNQHYRMGLGLDLTQFQRNTPLWHTTDGNAQFGIIRYEELDTAFPVFCDWALGQTPRLPVANESGRKPFSNAISAAFATQEAARLQAALKRSDYARHFGYAA
ncbi:hypothetical protein [Gymnodinialimonas hymeniacidonis]|uniref:hypothetical protein n=1 Tax=Gymnodinialimonas hymeniacidonis TaxID=3126508 RepID=UPI0034C5EC66